MRELNASLASAPLIEVKKLFRSCSQPCECTEPEHLVPGLEPGSTSKASRKMKDLRQEAMCLRFVYRALKTPNEKEHLSYLPRYFARFCFIAFHPNISHHINVTLSYLPALSAKEKENWKCAGKGHKITSSQFDLECSGF